MRSLIGVMSTASLPVPHVSSRIVSCDSCGRSCWLSEATGQDTIDKAGLLGTPKFACDLCIGRMQGLGMEIEFYVSQAVIREAGMDLCRCSRPSAATRNGL